MTAPEAVRGPSLLDAAHLNFVEAYALLARAADGGEVLDVGGATATVTGIPEAEFNRVYLLDPDSDTAEVLDAASSYFARRRLPWMLIVPERVRPEMARETLQRRLAPARRLPILTIDLESLTPPEAVGGLEIDAVRGPVEAQIFARILAEGFGAPRDLFGIFAAPGAWDAPGLTSYIAWHHGLPAGTATRLDAGGVTGLYNITTLKPFRRWGIGRALTSHVLAEAAREGPGSAILQASPMGYPVYRRIGFSQAGSYQAWHAPVTGNGSAFPFPFMRGH